PILEGAGFAFIRVAYEVFVPLVLLGHEAPFQPGRETCPAPSAQCGLLDFIDDFFGRNLLVENFSQCSVAFAPLIAPESPVVRVRRIQPGQHDLRWLAHLPSSSSNSSILSSDMRLHIRLLLSRRTGASPQDPMHSPSFSVNFPSAVVSLKSMPSFCRKRATASLAPESAQGRLVQIVILYLPSGCRLY